MDTANRIARLAMKDVRTVGSSDRYRRVQESAIAARIRPMVEAGDVECDKCVLTADCTGIERHCASCQRKIVRRYFKALAHALREPRAELRVPTPEEADAAMASAGEIPMSDAEIQRIAKQAVEPQAEPSP